MSILIRSDGETGLLTGDVAHHPCQMAHLDWSSTADSDPVQSAVTRRELFSRFARYPDTGDRRPFQRRPYPARWRGLQIHRLGSCHAAPQLNFPSRCSKKHPSQPNHPRE